MQLLSIQNNERINNRSRQSISLQLNTLRIGFSQPFNAILCGSRWMGKLPSHCFIQLQVKMKTSNFMAASENALSQTNDLPTPLQEALL